MYKKLSHPTYPDLGDRSWSEFEYIVPKTVDKHTAPVITKTPLYYGSTTCFHKIIRNPAFGLDFFLFYF